MGLMNKLNKMKSFLFDEEDDEKEVVKKSSKKASKKEEKVGLEKEPVKIKEEEKVEELYFDVEKDDKVVSDTNQIKSRSQKVEEKFKFPEFDDDDFLVANKKPEPIIAPKKEEPKRTLYQGSKRKEETKKFKPSPIISPIYGLLDNQGNMVKEEKKTDKTPGYSEEKTFDEVRKKAYGKLDEELENTMKRLSNKTIEEAEKEMKEENLSRQKKNKAKPADKPLTVEAELKKSEEQDDDDDMILPNINFKEIDIDLESKKASKTPVKEKAKNKPKLDDDDDDDDTKEQDLFNLIDTMYQNKEEE